jgi:chaperonin GroES|tara:strand:+ start:205 stop:462 length:258 start_codon:yes stop_codon:yes gene_type:complete
MKAVNYYIVVERTKEEEVKVGGFIMTDRTNEDMRYYKGKVISYGDKVDFLKENDVVWYDKIAGHSIEFEGKLYFVIKASDIVLVD